LGVCYKIKLLFKGLNTIYVLNYWRLEHQDFEVLCKLGRIFVKILCVPHFLWNVLTSKEHIKDKNGASHQTESLQRKCETKNREKLAKHILWNDYVRQNGAWRRSTQKIFKGNVRHQLHSSKFTENFKGIVLKAPLILNVNCVKTLQ